MSSESSQLVHPRAPRRRWPLGAATCLLVLVILPTAFFLDTQVVRTRIMQTEIRPANVEYDGPIYYAGLLRQKSWLLHRRLPDVIMVSRDPDMVYGHPVDFEILGNRDPVVESARWTPEGVSIRFDSGHEIFVPARAFIGGR